MSRFTKIRDKIISFIKREAKVVAKFLAPTIDSLKVQLKQFAKEDLDKIVAEAAQCIKDGKGEKCAINAAISTLESVAKQQGKELARTAVTSIAANLVEKAKAELEE